MLAPLRRLLVRNRPVALLAFVLVCVHVLQLHIHANVDHAQAQLSLSSVVPADHEESDEFDIVAEGLFKHIDGSLPLLLLLCIAVVAVAMRKIFWPPAQTRAKSHFLLDLHPPPRAPPR